MTQTTKWEGFPQEGVNDDWDRWPSLATARGYICASCRRIIAKDEYVSWSLRFSGWCDRCLGVLERIR